MQLHCSRASCDVATHQCMPTCRAGEGILAVPVPGLLGTEPCGAPPRQCFGHVRHAGFTSESSFSKSLSLLAAAIASSAFCFDSSCDTPLLPCSPPFPFVAALFLSCSSRQCFKGASYMRFKSLPPARRCTACCAWYREQQYTTMLKEKCQQASKTLHQAMSSFK